MTHRIEVGVADVLRARDERVRRQRDLLEAYGAPVISFTMNIAGPVKTDGLIQRGFFEGVKQVEAVLRARRAKVLQRIETIAATGNEQLWSVQAQAGEIKRWMCAIEESHPLGRLFDLDVLDEAGQKLARTGGRRCLICGGEVHACARSRAHSLSEITERTQMMLRDFFDEAGIRFIGECAQRALLYEAITTPKPGLVDCHDSGAHRDMDLFSFAASASALGEWFERSARIGVQMRKEDAAEVFACLRAEGIRAEERMLEASGGVNTHKGALFSLGIICCAAGMAGEEASLEEILDAAARLARGSLEDLTSLGPEQARTGGERQYLEAGFTGVRGEASAGFPSVREAALPAFMEAISRGESVNDAGLHALIALMARLDDSNILRRRDGETLRQVKARAGDLRERGFSRDDLSAMNADFVRENISPGGSADLLAVTYFLYMITRTYGGKAHERDA